MPDAVDLHADAGPLTGQVRVPAAAGAEEDRGRLGGLLDNPGDDAAELPGGEDGVEEGKDVLGSQGRGEDRGRLGQLS